MEVPRRIKTVTALRVSHAKSLQDISELKKLRESVGKNIREAFLLVDGHERDLTEHCENLRRTRESFSQFERTLSNAASLDGGVIRRKFYDDRLNSCSSGEESISYRSRNGRPSSITTKWRTGSDYDDDYTRYNRRYSYCSNGRDDQSLSSAYSYSPKSQRSGKLKQIVVPIYEDSFDSGVSLQTTSPRTSSGSSEVKADGTINTEVRDDHDMKSYSSRGTFYDSDASSAVSFPRPPADIRRQIRRNQQQQHEFILSQTWRSTPNLLNGGSMKFPGQRDGSLSDAKSCNSLAVSKREFATKTKSSEWKSLPDLGSKSNKSSNSTTKRKRKGLAYLFRRITKSGEYVLKNDENENKLKSKMKKQISKDDGISFPSSASPLGKTIEIIEGKKRLHRVEIKLPKNGLFGFYVQKGFRKSKKGVFIGSFVNQQVKKLFAGVIREGDEIIEMNSEKVDEIGFEKVLQIFNDTKVLNLLIFPYMYRKK